MECPRCRREMPDGAKVCPYDGEALQDAPETVRQPVQMQTTPDVGVVYGKRYVVKGALGGGAMSRIYLAENAFTKELVAIKVLEGHEARRKELHERFVREVRTIDALEHPNIVRLLDAGARRDGAPYLVMEYLRGESLRDRLKRQKQLSVEESLWIARQIASGLAAAHAAGVIHRDVKPGNIFLLGEPGHVHGVKLVDFGLVRLPGESSLTEVGVTVGTLEYMAPEQAVKDPTGPRSDMYALGCVMYRMLTGRLPFKGSDAEVLAQHLITPPKPPSAFLPGLDSRIEAVILTAMRKLPRNRYPAMEDLLEDIERLIGTKGGELSAGVTFEKDLYKPHTAYAKSIAALLYAKLGRAPPTWD